MNKLYISPDFEIIRVEILDEVLSSSRIEDEGNPPVIDGGDWDEWGSGSEDEGWW